MPAHLQRHCVRVRSGTNASTILCFFLLLIFENDNNANVRRLLLINLQGRKWLSKIMFVKIIIHTYTYYIVCTYAVRACPPLVLDFSNITALTYIHYGGHFDFPSKNHILFDISKSVRDKKRIFIGTKYGESL